MVRFNQHLLTLTGYKFLGPKKQIVHLFPLSRTKYIPKKTTRDSKKTATHNLACLA